MDCESKYLDLDPEIWIGSRSEHFHTDIINLEEKSF